MIAGDRSTYLFNFGEEGVEILDLGTFAFCEPRLYQTSEAKSVVHPDHAATVRALVVRVRGRWKRISKAGKIHFSLSQLAAGR
jgi:hypothetical protein